MGVMAVTKYVEEDCLHANAWKSRTARECRNRSVTLNIKNTPHTRVEYKVNIEDMLSLKIAKTCHVCNELAVIIIVNDT